MKKFAGTCLIILSAQMIGCEYPPHTGTVEEYQIEISVNPTIELFSVIHHLAGDGQYNENLLPNYNEQVDRHFEQVKNHPAIKYAKECSTLYRINGDAPMALAIYIGQPPQLEPEMDLSAFPNDFDPRWDSTLVSNYLEQARAFALESEFMEFYHSQQAFHTASIKSLTKMVFKENIVEWFFHFFGYDPDHFRITVALLNGSCNYGYHKALPDGSYESVCLLGARDPKWISGTPTYTKKHFLPVIIHEFCHSYINPLFISKPEEFKAIGEEVLKSHYEAMRKKGYDEWNVVLNEYLVRASTIHYLKEYGDRESVERNINNDKDQGFTEIEGLVQLLDTYKNSRMNYPDIESFLPEIRKYFRAGNEAE